MLTDTETSLLHSASVDEAWRLLEDITAFAREQPRDVDRAVELVADRLRAHGVPAQVGDMMLFLSLPGHARVETGGQTLLAKASAMSRPAPRGLTAELVYVPGRKDLLASVLNPLQPEEGVRERICGRIVLSEGLGGPAMLEALAPFRPAALIAINPGDEIHSGICTPIWGNPDLQSLAHKPAIPVVGVSRPDGERLKALARHAGEATIFSELEEGWFPSKYVQVEIRGARDPERFVLVHGHIDSWDVGVGDNGTGVVTLYEVARMLWAQRVSLDRSVRILWWPGHSTGRYAGSTWYADNHAIDLVKNCVGHINCDSPGCRWATAYNDLFCMPEAAKFLAEVIRDVTGRSSAMMRPLRAGDWSFSNLGITGLLALSSTMPPELVAAKGYYRVGGNGGNIEWHTARDRIEIADRQVLLSDIRLYALTAFRLAALDILPFDFRAAVREYRSSLEHYRSAAGGVFDLAPAVSACEALSSALDAFYAAVTDGTVSAPAANEAIIALERTLVPAHFAARSRYQQDPAMEVPPLPSIALSDSIPSLSPAHALFALTQLVRGRNELVAAFDEAARTALSARS